MSTNLPTDIEATYPDASPGDAAHQAHHDEIHAYTNSHDTAPDPHGDRAYADAAIAAHEAAAMATVARVAAQSMPSGADTLVSFDTEADDTAGFYSSTVPTRLTIPPGKAGRYLIIGQVTIGAETGAGSERGVKILRNGAVLAHTPFPPIAGQFLPVQISTAATMLDGDYLQLQFYQDSGAALSTLSVGSNVYTYLTLVRLGA